MSRSDLRPLAPATFLLLWSAGFAFVALGLPDSEPITFLALRYAIVVAVLLAAIAVLRPPLPETRREWLDLIVVGLLLQAAYFTLLYLELDLESSAGTVALIVSLQPILVALLAPRPAGERVTKVRWAGLALGRGRQLGDGPPVRRRGHGGADRGHALRAQARQRAPSRHRQRGAVHYGARGDPAPGAASCRSRCF